MDVLPLVSATDVAEMIVPRARGRARARRRAGLWMVVLVLVDVLMLVSATDARADDWPVLPMWYLVRVASVRARMYTIAVNLLIITIIVTIFFLKSSPSSAS